jgi:hypothetical protein
LLHRQHGGGKITDRHTFVVNRTHRSLDDGID